MQAADSGRQETPELRRARPPLNGMATVKPRQPARSALMPSGLTVRSCAPGRRVRGGRPRLILPEPDEVHAVGMGIRFHFRAQLDTYGSCVTEAFGSINCCSKRSSPSTVAPINHTRSTIPSPWCRYSRSPYDETKLLWGLTTPASPAHGLLPQDLHFPACEIVQAAVTWLRRTRQSCG